MFGRSSLMVSEGQIVVTNCGWHAITQVNNSRLYSISFCDCCCCCCYLRRSISAVCLVVSRIIIRKQNKKEWVNNLIYHINSCQMNNSRIYSPSFYVCCCCYLCRFVAIVVGSLLSFVLLLVTSCRCYFRCFVAPQYAEIFSLLLLLLCLLLLRSSFRHDCCSRAAPISSRYWWCCRL